MPSEISEISESELVKKETKKKSTFMIQHFSEGQYNIL